MFVWWCSIVSSIVSWFCLRLIVSWCGFGMCVVLISVWILMSSGCVFFCVMSMYDLGMICLCCDRNSVDGLVMLCSLCLVIVNMLSLLIVLKWFLNVCMSWNDECVLFLKYSIVLMMCLSMCGLVRLFFFVMCLIMMIVVFDCFVMCVSCVVYLCICVIELGVDVSVFE